METKDMFQQALIDLNVSLGTAEDLFSLIARRLERLGFVKDGYLKGIIEREEQFPTGLITEYLNIALPHSDTKFIERPFIYVVRTTEPIKVKQMGDNQEMEVKNIFFLGIKDPTKQVGLLQELMLLFQNEQFVHSFQRLDQEEEMYHLFMNQWEEVKNG